MWHWGSNSRLCACKTMTESLLLETDPTVICSLPKQNKKQTCILWFGIGSCSKRKLRYFTGLLLTASTFCRWSFSTHPNINTKLFVFYDSRWEMCSLLIIKFNPNFQCTLNMIKVYRMKSKILKSDSFVSK